jgi:two-component system, chemotaxis family, response regulator Rcp1
MSSKPAEILLAEDNPADAFLIKACMKSSPIKTHVHVVEDGIELMAYLRKEGAYSKAVRPDLILLDLNLPQKDGREVLAEIKADETLRRIPVIILTSSDADKDIAHAYDLHANSYLRKPADYPQYYTAMEALLHYWFSLVSLPDR